MLPEIKSSSRGLRRGQGHGDRRRARCRASSATSRPRCSARPASTPGDAKNTYGTGSFLLVNTGEEIVHTEKLLTTVGYKLGDGTADLRARGLDRGHRRADPVAARPARRSSTTAPEVEELAKTVDDNGGVYFVPAFSGLFAPHWRDDARGVDRRPDRATPTRATSPARRWRPTAWQSQARSSTPPTTSPTCRSTSCASTAA